MIHLILLSLKNLFRFFQTLCLTIFRFIKKVLNSCIPSILSIGIFKLYYSKQYVIWFYLILESIYIIIPFYVKLSIILIIIYPVMSKIMFKLTFFITSKYLKSENNKIINYNEYSSYYKLLIYCLIVCLLYTIKYLLLTYIPCSIETIYYSLFLIICIIIIIYPKIIRKILLNYYNQIKSDPCYFISSKLTFIFCMKYSLLIIILLFSSSDEIESFLWIVFTFYFFDIETALDIEIRNNDNTLDYPACSMLGSDEDYKTKVLTKLSNLSLRSVNELNSKVLWTKNNIEFVGTILQIPRCPGKDYWAMVVYNNNGIRAVPFNKIGYVTAIGGKIGIFEKIDIKYPAHKVFERGVFWFPQDFKKKRFYFKFISYTSPVTNDAEILTYYDRSKRFEYKKFNPLNVNHANINLFLKTKDGEHIDLHYKSPMLTRNIVNLGNRSNLKMCKWDVHKNINQSNTGRHKDFYVFGLVKT